MWGCSSLGGSGDGRYGCDSDNQTLLNPRSNTPRKLPEPELIMSPEVRREMHHYLKDRRTLRYALANRKRYQRMLKEVFSDEGVPESLINVAFVESKYSPNERSSAGAAGMWQFTKDTGRLYGLEIGYFEDQRKDAILSTIAAARHLYDLYDKFRDWPLAVAAYNGGPTGVELALRKTRTSDFFELARHKELNEETVQFVYRFLAVCFIMREMEGEPAPQDPKRGTRLARRE